MFCFTEVKFDISLLKSMSPAFYAQVFLSINVCPQKIQICTNCKYRKAVHNPFSRKKAAHNMLVKVGTLMNLLKNECQW